MTTRTLEIELPVTTVSLRMPEDVVQDLERLGAELETIPEHRGAQAGDERARDTD